MATVTKTVRIDEEFLSIIEDYNKISKEIFGVCPTVSNILSGTIVKGFADNLQVFRVLQTATFPNQADAQKINDELKAKMMSVVERFAQYEIDFLCREE